MASLTSFYFLACVLAYRLAPAAAFARNQRYQYNTTVARDPNKLNVHIVCHTHDDAGWLKTVDQYYFGARQDIQVAGVQFILTSVIQALRDNPDRKFVYGEMAFFTMWWAYQSDATREFVKQLVEEGRLDFVNGGYVQHDEAAAHYVAMIDQTTRGHRFLNETFGKAVKVAWQVDPFGHSATQASLMSAAAGFEALFFGRADYQDVRIRHRIRAMELVWRASKSWAPGTSDIFTHIYDGYGPLPGFNFEWFQLDPPIIDDPQSPDYNVPQRVEWFVREAQAQAAMTRGSDIIFLEGTDFTYANANPWFISLDRLIHYANLDGRVNVFYSTPADFIAAKRSYPPASVQWPLKTDDFFPYADCPDCYWTGYFTSRPTSKRYIRAATSFLQAARQLEVLSGLDSAGALDALEAAVSLTQHHDSITGTAKQAVANDYHRRLHLGWEEAAEFTGRALGSLLLPQPRAGSEPPPPTPSEAPTITSRRLAAAARPLPHPIKPRPASDPPGPTPPPVPPPTPPPTLTQCPYLNASICDVSVAVTAQGGEVMVVVYNPLAWSRTHHVRVPLGSGPYIYRVEDAAGAPIPSQLLPEYSSTKALQLALLTTQQVTDLASVAAQSLAFAAHLPPLGFKTYFIRSTAAPTPPPSPAPTDPTPDPDPPGTVQISNSHLTLTFNAMTGLLTGVGATNGTSHLPLSHSLLWYRGSDGHEPTQTGLGSGAYIFRVPLGVLDPTEVADPEEGVRVRVVKGPLVQEVHQEFGSWGHVTTRLWEGAEHVEVEWTVGPIPVEEDRVAKEVVSRWSSELATEGVLYTDSNGREMQRRVRDFRPSWNLTVTQPVTGNFYPITTAAAITDGQTTLSVVTERGQGAASLADGQLEVMVHRRCVGEDQRGVGEALNETECSCRDCNCMGLIARGTHLLSILPSATAGAASRRLQVLLNDPPLLSFAALPPPAPAPTIAAAGGAAGGATEGGEEAGWEGGLQGGARGGWEGLRGDWSGAKGGEGLPENVHLVTLMQLGPGRLLLRLAHNLQVGEHAELSLPAKVDLSQLLSSYQLASIQELSLSANQYKAHMAMPHQWPVEPQPAAPPSGSPDPQYDINSHNDTLPVVEIFPMEIRTFEILTA